MRSRRKKPKTLSGIETLPLPTRPASIREAGKNLKPYQGLKQQHLKSLHRISGRKKPKTLSGIETQFFLRIGRQFNAGKNLKPYQGLKHECNRALPSSDLAGKNLKPYQGLKRAS